MFGAFGSLNSELAEKVEIRAEMTVANKKWVKICKELRSGKKNSKLTDLPGGGFLAVIIFILPSSALEPRGVGRLGQAPCSGGRRRQV